MFLIWAVLTTSQCLEEKGAGWTQREGGGAGGGAGGGGEGGGKGDRGRREVGAKRRGRGGRGGKEVEGGGAGKAGEGQGQGDLSGGGEMKIKEERRKEVMCGRGRAMVPLLPRLPSLLPFFFSLLALGNRLACSPPLSPFPSDRANKQHRKLAGRPKTVSGCCPIAFFLFGPHVPAADCHSSDQLAYFQHDQRQQEVGQAATTTGTVVLNKGPRGSPDSGHQFKEGTATISVTRPLASIRHTTSSVECTINGIRRNS